MAAIDSLNTSLDNQTAVLSSLTDAVLALVDEVKNQPGTTEAQIAAAQVRVDQNTATQSALLTAINAVLTPPATP